MNGNWAAVDIGTNSIHLVVARARNGNRFEILAQEKEVVRLGSGSKDMKYLKQDAIDRGIETLKRYRQIAGISNAEVRAVATSAVREALNRDVFIDRARKEAGIRVEVISGFEEARLIYLGVLQALPIFEMQTLLVDIGGGSSEFLVGKRGQILGASSLKLGAIRITDRFFREEPLSGRKIQQCRDYLKFYMNPMARALRKLRHEVAVGSSGTILNLAEMIQIQRGADPTRQMSNFNFSSSELSELVKRLIRADTLKKRQKITGLDPKRVDIILGGALILEQAFAEFQIGSMTVSGFALREGVILDSMHKAGGDRLHLTDIRYRGVVHLAQACDYEKEHADQVARLSLQLFDQLRDLHGLSDEHREYLEAAAILHNVGLFISHAQHHHHSYYIIRNSEYLTGFTDREIELIAQVARYHRKSNPKLKHAEFARLKGDDRQIVRKLAGILRVADALNRTHASLVRCLWCERRGANLTVHLETVDRREITLEIYTAESRKDLLEQSLGVKARFLAESDRQ